MKKLFSLSYRHKVFLVLVLLMNVPFLLTGYMAKSLIEGMMLREKEGNLLAFARILDSSLEPGGFDAILRRAGAENAPREERIRVLNEALRGITDTVSASSPGLGAGYYSRALDAILTYGPSASYANAVGLSIPPEHPGHIVMRENRALARSGSMVRGDILNAMIPIERGGAVIGYIWANELTTDITAQLRDMAQTLFFAVLFCLILTVGLLFLLSRRTVRDADRIITGVRAMRSDLSRRIEDSEGELGEVAKSINAMAADIAKANEETSRAMSMLQSVLSNVDAAVYVCDPRTKTLVYCNEYLCKLLGREGDPVGNVCHEVLRSRSEPCEDCPQPRLYDGEGNPVFTPLRWETHNPVLNRDFLVTDRLVTWHDGRLLHMEVATDVTERKALALAEASNKAQKDFLARMSHELRTPMNGVLGMTHLAMQADPPPAQLEYLKKIQSSASLLLGIINDILDFSRIEAGKLGIERHSFKPRDMVENIRELLLPRIAEKNLRFTVDLDESVPAHAVGDELRLSQVLLNLLGNASKFTLEGHIALRMRCETLPQGDLRLFCEVEDSGIGLSGEELHGLFKPFAQADSSTSRKFGGTGLGLSISKALVELMGGAIGVKSELGRGSVFYFYVDLDPLDGPPETEGEDERLWADARYEGRSFLLVEDNAINQEIALAILEDLGAAVDVAANGEEGLTAFLQKDYDIILMDVRMPVMDGLEATRRIRASAKRDAASVPVIAMTANAMQEDRDACADAGMDGHIAKPMDVAELKGVLFHFLHTG